MIEREEGEQKKKKEKRKIANIPKIYYVCVCV